MQAPNLKDSKVDSLISADQAEELDKRGRLDDQTRIMMRKQTSDQNYARHLALKAKAKKSGDY